MNNVDNQSMDRGADGWRTGRDEKSDEMKEVWNMAGNWKQNMQYHYLLNTGALDNALA